MEATGEAPARPNVPQPPTAGAATPTCATVAEVLSISPASILWRYAMISNGTLINHCGATPVTRNDLEIIVAPPSTETWYPVSHQEVLCCVEETLGSSGFRIEKQQLSVSNQQQR